MAHDEAARMGAQLISTEHLLLGLMRLQEGSAVELLERLDIDLERLQSDLRRQMEAAPPADLAGKEPSFTPEAKRVLLRALKEAQQLGDYSVGTEHILIGLLREGRGAAFRLLHRHGADLPLIRQALAETGRHAMPREREKRSKTPTLDHFSRDLTQMARDGQLDPVIGRDEETERVIQILCRRTKNNPCLIGEAGVGKTAIVEGLAQHITDGDVPALLRDRRVVALDLASLVAGTKYRGEFEERMKRVMEEIRASQGEIIVFLDELHTIVGTGAAEGAMDASNILKPALARGELQCIGATTLDEFRKHIEKTPSLERRFQPVMVREPDRDQTLDILQGIKERYEEYHGVSFTPEALEASVDLSTRYIADRSLPDKAIDLLDEAGSRVKLRGYRQEAPAEDIPHTHALHRPRPASLPSDLDNFDDDDYDGPDLAPPGFTADWEADETTDMPQVSYDDIAQIVATWTGIPVVSLTEAESQRLLRMEAALHEDIVAQDEAIRTIARAVRRSRAGIKDPNRPTGSFIFLGPTGVGKTYLARMLAKFLFGNEDALVRIDMSEYMEKFAVSRLVGAPPGYVGYEESGQLTEAVRRRPYSVVLFDEIEKAHPEVFSILLQIMEDGRLTDAQGRVVDFKNCIVIMTSNVGARLITNTSAVGFVTDKAARTAQEHRRDYARMRTKVIDELKKTFSPEFLNRVDDILVFHALTQEEIAAIVDMEIDKVTRQLRGRGLALTITDEVRDLLVREGYDPDMGARPLRRAIRKYVEDPLSEYLLRLDQEVSGEITVSLDEEGNTRFVLQQTADALPTT
ncbi:ATP-dependent Clp protease ATP-binding subunit [bacterium]|nr:ATP-dependent Clp protease ATP-binding subunit [bacterium]